MGCDAICIFAIKVQNKYTFCIGWVQINSIISISSILIGLTSIIIENIFLITTKPYITSSSKGEVFVLGSLISVSTHSSLLALSSTWLSSPHQYHHYIIAIIMILIVIISMRKCRTNERIQKSFNQNWAILTSCDNTLIPWLPCTYMYWHYQVAPH